MESLISKQVFCINMTCFCCLSKRNECDYPIELSATGLLITFLKKSPSLLIVLARACLHNTNRFNRLYFYTDWTPYIINLIELSFVLSAQLLDIILYLSKGIITSTIRGLHNFFEAFHSAKENLWTKNKLKTGARDEGAQESQ